MTEASGLRINMLGEFSLHYGDKTVSDSDSRSRKSWALLAYLILNRERQLSQSELIDLLWDDESSSNPVSALKTMCHRLRRLLDKLEHVPGQEMIVVRDGNYGWNRELDISVDADEFVHCCTQAATSRNRKQRLEYYRRAVALYRGELLPCCASEPWVIAGGAYYNSLYIQAMQKLIELLWEDNCLDEIILLCAQAIKINPYEESFYANHIRALADSGNSQAALVEYKNMNELFFSKFGVTPSDELKALYRQVVRATNSQQTDLNVIRDQLKEALADREAFYCEFEFFKDVYRIEARTASRRGGAIHLALLTVSDRQGNELNQRSRNLAMKKLQTLIASSLRRGDVFTKYSVSQYIIMLHFANYEDSRMVIDRLVSRFRRENPHSPAYISYSVQPLEPIM